ncbi:TM2 domain-containing protein [Macrococcus brunensis]|uniref:TM2 domain-containing protein n=1 Tax=Macrococcus brunensis TaxID=198483 RepID=UPI001EF111DA|nr:TM2 domain-containing protein [Macrococcus brunensis]ULG72416.1 TM2 domain-containing protein [Macrococcus brunensis]ULG74670.1 TM2 domain-containing protein [Macrococcus brunensis]
MNIHESSFIESKVANNKKSPVVAYLLWFFLGGFGGHRFYFGKTGSAIAMIAVTLLVNWWLFWIPMAIWLIVDLFLIQNMLKEDEAKVRHAAIQEVHMMNGNHQPAQSQHVARPVPAAQPSAPVQPEPRKTEQEIVDELITPQASPVVETTTYTTQPELKVVKNDEDLTKNA